MLSSSYSKLLYVHIVLCLPTMPTVVKTLINKKAKFWICSKIIVCTSFLFYFFYSCTVGVFESWSDEIQVRIRQYAFFRIRISQHSASNILNSGLESCLSDLTLYFIFGIQYNSTECWNGRHRTVHHDNNVNILF